MKTGFVLFEFLCALMLGTLVLFYVGSFWVSSCNSFYKLTSSRCSFLAVMHSISFIRRIIEQAPTQSALWSRSYQKRNLIEWREDDVRKKLVFKENMLVFQVNEGKTFFSKVLVKDASGSFDLLVDGFSVLGVRMHMQIRKRDFTAVFACVPVVKV